MPHSMFRLSFLLIIIVLFFSSCRNDYDEQKYELIINDSLHILTPDEKESFIETEFPVGIAPYLITVDSLDKMLPGVSADELFEQIIEIYPESKAFKKRGFLIVVSQNPSLIQTRAGAEIKNFAQWKGVIAGQEYLKIQQTAYHDSLSEALPSLFKYLQKRLPEIDSISWWNKMQYNQAMLFISSEVEEFGLPSDSFYGNYLLKPVFKLRIWELNKWGSWWFSYLIVGFAIFLLTKLLTLIIKLLLRKVSNGGLRSLINWVFVTLIGLYLSFPALSSAVVLSSGRLEDILALSASGIPFTDYFSLNTSSFNVATPWYFAVSLTLIYCLRAISGQSLYFTWSFLPEEKQQQMFSQIEKNNLFFKTMLIAMGTRGMYTEEIMSEDEFRKKPFTNAFYNNLTKQSQKAGLWGFMAIAFLSKAIVLTAIFIWIFPVISGYYQYFKSIRKFNRQYPEYKINLIYLIVPPVFIATVVAVIQGLKFIYGYLLLGLLFFLSSGVLISVLVDSYFSISNRWLLWGLTLIIPLYYIVRLMISYKQRKIFIRYLIVTLFSFSLLAYLYLYQPQHKVKGVVEALFPITEGILIETKVIEIKPLGVIKVDFLNVRGGPGINFEVVSQISNKDTFEIINMEEKWWHIRFKESDGYISSGYAEEISPLVD